MLKALKANQLIEKYSLQLLKYSLSADQADFWKLYDQMLDLLGYAKVYIDGIHGESFVIKCTENQMFYQYKVFIQQKLLSVDLLQTIEMKRYWQQQLLNSDQFPHSNSIHCILTPLSFSLNSQIYKISDYKISPYAFYFKENIVYSNKIASKKGILKGLPILLAKKIDPDTKLVELNCYTQHKFQQIFDVFKAMYKELKPYLKRQEIHFKIIYDSQNSSISEILKLQIQAMLQNLYQLSGLKMFAFASKNQIICDILIKDTPLSLIEGGNKSVKILIDGKEVRQGLKKCKISSIPGISFNQVRFLSPNIRTVGELLDNLDVLGVMTSPEQTQIFMQACLGIDHRQNLQYIEARRKDFSEVGLNYNRIIAPDDQVGIEVLKRVNDRPDRMNQEVKDFDSKSEKLLDGKYKQRVDAKSEKNPLIKPTSKQQYFPMFGKKGNK